MKKYRIVVSVLFIFFLAAIGQAQIGRPMESSSSSADSLPIISVPSAIFGSIIEAYDCVQPHPYDCSAGDDECTKKLLTSYFQSQINNPVDGEGKKIYGYVQIKSNVRLDGSLNKIEVHNRSDIRLVDEAIRVVKQMNKKGIYWSAAKLKATNEEAEGQIILKIPFGGYIDKETNE